MELAIDYAVKALYLVMILSISFGSALVPISAAAYGQGNYRKIRATYMYGLKYSVLAMVCLAAVAMVTQRRQPATRSRKATR